MGTHWRLLDTGSISAARNMALDQVILNARSSNQVPNTVRFLQFSPHCVLVGYHQSVELEIEEHYCREQGIEINRRITGGVICTGMSPSLDGKSMPRRIRRVFPNGLRICTG